MKLARIALRNIKRNRRRSLLSGSAIALAALVIVFMFSWEGGMMGDFKNNIFHFVSGHTRIRHGEYDKDEELNPLHLRITGYRSLAEELEQQEQVSAVLPRIQFPTAIYRDGRNFAAVGLGIDFGRAAPFMDLDQMLQEGALPQGGQREILLSSGLAEDVGLKIGDKVTLLGKSMYMGMTAMTFRISGLVQFPVAAFNSTYFLLPLETAQRFLKMGDSVSELLVLLRNPNKLGEAVALQEALLQSRGARELSVKPWTAVGTVHAMVRYADTVYNFMALFFLILATTVIINTTMMVIYERMREIGTVAAMGMTPAEIVRLFFLEAFFIGLMASFTGVALGIGITLPLSVLGMDLSGMIEGMSYEISSIIYPQLNPRSTIFVFLYSVLIASLASFIPSRRAAKIAPVEALRSL